MNFENTTIIIMNFENALKELNIEDYSDRIMNSNSHGEFFHLIDYVLIAENLTDKSWFRQWFENVVKSAEQNWERPESVFQHIFKIAESHLQQ